MEMKKSKCNLTNSLQVAVIYDPQDHLLHNIIFYIRHEKAANTFLKIAGTSSMHHRVFTGSAPSQMVSVPNHW